MRLTSALAFCCLALGGLAGCTDPYPLAADLTEADRRAPYPALLPAEQIRAQVPPPRTTERTQPDLDARAARLRARAAGLRAPVIDAETQSRLEQGTGG